MTTTPPPDIESTVAAFRDQLATATAIDTEQLSRDVQQLAQTLANAPTHHLASSAIHDFAETHPPAYATQVIVGGLSAFAITVLINGHPDELDGAQGHLARLLHVSFTIRTLGITTHELHYLIPGEVY